MIKPSELELQTQRQELKNKLLQLLEQRFAIHFAQQPEDHLRLNEDCSIDSVMMMQLLVYLEIDCQLTIPPDAINPTTFRTIGDVVTLMMHIANDKE